MNLLELLNLLPLITAIVGVVFFRFLTGPFRLVVAMCFLAFITELVGMLLTETSHSNAWVYNIHTLFELWLLGGVAVMLLEKYRSKVLVMVIGLTLFWVYQAISIGVLRFLNYAFIANSFFFFGAFLFVLYKNSRKSQSFFQMPDTWLSMAQVIYFTGTIPFWGMFNYLNAHSLPLSRKLYIINNALSVGYYVLIAFSFVLRARASKVALGAKGEMVQE